MNQLGIPRPRAIEIPRAPSNTAAIAVAIAMTKRRVVMASNAWKNATVEARARKTAPPRMGTHKARDQELTTVVTELKIELQVTTENKDPYFEAEFRSSQSASQAKLTTAS